MPILVGAALLMMVLTMFMPTGMQQDALVFRQPLRESLSGCPLCPAGFQEPGRSSSGTQFLPDGIGRTEPLLGVDPLQLMKTFHQIGRQGK